MEHDEDIPAVVRSTIASIAGGGALGGTALQGSPAALPEEEHGDARSADREAADERSSSDSELPPDPATAARPSDLPDPPSKDASSKDKGKRQPNNVRRLRIERMMSKAELARRANLSVLTIDRVEKGYGCRMDSKRKILEALGLSLADRVRVFGEEE
jgi:DNA-binding XRE family transcriptional regulator